jgi:hypothetical protein
MQTRERLRVFMARLQHAYELGTVQANERSDQVVTVDHAIGILLDRDQAKRERAAKSRSRSRRAVRQPEGGSAT